MRLTGIIDEDFVNYRLPSMFLSVSKCNNTCTGCQNQHLKSAKAIEVDNNSIAARYMGNPLTKAIVFGGLEPFDSFDELCVCYEVLRLYTNDTIVIYTGYNENELRTFVKELIKFGGHLIIKYGQYIKDQETHKDEILGVKLASDNQYAKEYNKI